MSKQQSMSTDEPEAPRHAGKSRKVTPWTVWYKSGAPFMKSTWRWFRMGRYRSKELAEAVVEADKRKHSWGNFRVMHESEGKPE